MKNANRTTRKDNSRRKGIPKAKQDQRRFEAGVRQEYYNSLTTTQKLEQIASRPGESKKEKARLLQGIK
jgi:hypothetical protein